MATDTATPVATTTRGESTRSASFDSRYRLFNWICFGVLVVFALMWLVPLGGAVDTSLKPNAETTKVPTTWFIENPTLDSYRSTLQQGDMPKWLASSFLTSAAVAAGTVITASMAAYALSRLQFRGRQFIFVLILAGIMIPGQVLIVPLFREMDGLNLLNTYWAVILPQIPTAIAVFIFKQFFDGLPRELEEAATVDGSSYWRPYRQISMLLARPAVAAVAIFTFVTTWNNRLCPLLVLPKPNRLPVPVVRTTVQG